MKKLLLASALLIAATATTFAGSHTLTAPMLAEKNISATIRGQIQFPDFLKDSEGDHEATIIFRVNSCGTILVKEIQSEDADLREDLLSQAANIKINPANLDTRDTYKVVVRFRTL